MGLSKDPGKREAQLANLAAGRKMRDARREAGLAPRRRRRVVEAGYDDAPTPKPTSSREGARGKAAKARRSEGSSEGRGGDGPPRWARVLGRVMGID